MSGELSLKKLYQKYFPSSLHKFFLLFLFFSIAFHSPFSTLAMDNERAVADERTPLAIPRSTPSIENEGMAIDGDIDIDTSPRKNDHNDITVVEEAAPAAPPTAEHKTVTTLNQSDDHALRKNLNQIIETLVLKDTKLKKDLAEEGHFKWGGLILKPTQVVRSQAPQWDDIGEFYDGFDDALYRKKTTTCRKVLTVPSVLLGLLLGFLEPGGIVALTWGLGYELFSLGENLPDSVSQFITIATLLFLLPPCMEQAVTFMGHVLDFFFGGDELTESKDDAKPHKQKLGYEKETGLRHCCKYFKIPTVPLYYVTSAAYALAATAPFAVIFWQLEKSIPGERAKIFFWREVFPLIFYIAERKFTETVRFFKGVEHQRHAAVTHMWDQKRRILLHRLDTMEKLLTSPHSNNLANLLYKHYESTLKKINTLPSLSHDNNSILTEGEYLSLATLFFLRPEGHNFFDNLQTEFDEAPINEESALFELRSRFKEVPTQKMQRLIDHIDKLPAAPFPNEVVKAATTYLNGVSAVGASIVNAWAIKQPLLALGLNQDASSGIAYSVAIAQTLGDACAKSNIQKQTFLNLLDFGSTRRDLYGARWVTKFFSFWTSLFLSIPYPALIYQVLSDNGCDSLTALTFALAVSTVPTEWASNYQFLNWYYDKLITDIVRVLPAWSIKQKRTILLYELNRVRQELRELDQPSTEKLYAETQESI
ncbi:MAG: hypothetical protein K2P93_01225 [Alphaproteobacteria bacterium]|nr:hypothetical protein [Alphaproteobacteria bacterium]